MNPNLARLQTYPFEKLRALFAGIEPPAELKPIRLSIGEPQHPTPGFIRQTLADNLGGLSSYPATLGSDALRYAHKRCQGMASPCSGIVSGVANFRNGAISIVDADIVFVEN